MEFMLLKEGHFPFQEEKFPHKGEIVQVYWVYNKNTWTYPQIRTLWISTKVDKFVRINWIVALFWLQPVFWKQKSDSNFWNFPVPHAHFKKSRIHKKSYFLIIIHIQVNDIHHKIFNAFQESKLILTLF